MGAANRAGKKIKSLPQTRDEVVQRRFPGGEMMVMLRAIRGNLPITDIEALLVRPMEKSEIVRLNHAALYEIPYVRRRAQAVMFHQCGITTSAIMRVLILGRNTVKRYIRKFKAGGVDGLLERSHRQAGTKVDDTELREVVLSVIHSPPSAFGFNRTSWTIRLLKRALEIKKHPIGKNIVSKIIKKAGYKFWKAKEVLTSNDPNYREKLTAITEILSKLGPRDRFFSIDEFGPFAVKERGGRRLVRKEEYPTVPQFQRSKGSLIVTAALELSTNQVTHFYSTRKNSVEILKMTNVLVEKYSGCRTIYLSWDHASWHSSKILLSEILKLNGSRHRKKRNAPMVKLAPLPARSQFLNVIESVFSGMAAAIIQNSNYESVAQARTAIDRYFAERNAHFRKYPKRAGKKIWGKELVPAEFKEGQNCKDAAWR